MSDCSTHKKKPTNLKLIQIINSQKINDLKVLDLDKSNKNKLSNDKQSMVKGKKIDNKILKIKKKRGDDQQEGINQLMTNYNTNTESVSIIETLPFRDRDRQRSKQNRSRNDFSEGTHSICTFDINQQIEKGRRTSLHHRRASDLVKVSWNKENNAHSRSQSRNSLGFDRRMSYGRKVHNRSCNDMEQRGISRGQSRQKGKGQRGNQGHYMSCNDGGNVTITPERRKKSPKKSKKVSCQVTKNPTVKDINFKKVKIVDGKKKEGKESKEVKQSKLIKKKDKDKQKQKQHKSKKQNQSTDIPNFRDIPSYPHKRSIDPKQLSDPQQPQYPVSKYVSLRKRSAQIISPPPSIPFPFLNQNILLFSNSTSSLIKTIQTSKKQSSSEITQNDIPMIEIGQTSLNLKEIRKYEKINRISEDKLKRERRKLYQGIIDLYPGLEKKEIEFLSSVILVQRWWRDKNSEKKKRRVIEEDEPDKNLTEIIKSILNNAIKSQEATPNNQLVDGHKAREQQQGDRKRFFNDHDSPSFPPQLSPAPLSSKQPKQHNNSFQSYTINIGDLQIPESRIKLQQLFSSPSPLRHSQLFPPFDLLRQKRTNILLKYSTKMDKLQKNKSFQSSHQQHLLKQQMRKDLKKLDKDNKTIQKGYLTYLNCLQSIKTTPKSQSLLRKVSSSEGLMFELYRKTFKMAEGLMMESDSVEELAKKVLIRKEWMKEEKDRSRSPLVHFGSDPSSPVHLSFLNNLNKKEKLDDFIGRSAENVKPSKRSSSDNIEDGNVLSLNQILQEYRNDQTSQEVSEDYDSQIMANLLEEEEEENENDEIRANQVVDMIMELVYLELAEDIEDVPKLKKKFLTILQNRHIPGIDCSDSAIRYYLNIVIQQFLSTQKPSLVSCLNTPIGFSSLSILKLMRQPQFSPPDKYIPPVDPKSFFTIQKIYFDRIDLPSIYKKNVSLVQQLINIHNKAIYQCFLSQLQQMKPNGDDGIIHPWDYPRLINHSQITPQLIYYKLTQAIQKVMKHCSFKAGLILENWVTRNARELEKAYEENEERVVAMIANDLQEEEEGRWKDVDQFLLEVRLDVDVLVAQWVFEEAEREIRRMRR